MASIQNYQSKHSKLVGESTVATSDNASKPTMTAAELALQTPIILLEELCPLFQSAGYKGRKLRPPESLTPMWEVVGGCLACRIDLISFACNKSQHPHYTGAACCAARVIIQSHIKIQV